MSISLVDLTPNTVIPKYRPVRIPKKVVTGYDSIITGFIADCMEQSLAVAYAEALKKDSTLDPVQLVDQVYELIDAFIAARTDPVAKEISILLAKVAVKNYP